MSGNKEKISSNAIKKKKTAISASFDLLSIRDRSEKEMRSALVKKGYQKEEIDDTLLKLTNEGYLNDQRTANFWANCLFDKGQYGVHGIARKLIERGISEDLSFSASEAVYMDSDELDVALLIAKKKWPKAKDRTSAQRVVSSYLLRHGFSNQTIYKVLRCMEEEISDIT